MTELANQRATLRAIAEVVVPETAALDESGWAELERTIDQALAMRPALVRRQLRMLLRVIEQLPRLRTGRRFSSLDVGRRTEIVERLQRSRMLLVRRGLWGVRTLVMMGYYTRPATMTDLGYRATPLGWNARSMAP